jgi:hypothetical protein
MSDKNAVEQLAEAMKIAADRMLNDTKSIYAPCNNAYMDSRDGRTTCSCWRCAPKEGRR